MAEIVFVDTSVSLNLLNVPRKNSDEKRLTGEFKRLALAGALFVIPIAAVVEVGNHIAQLPSGHDRRDRAQQFARYLQASVDGRPPWVVSDASWDKAFLSRLLDGHGPRPGLVDLCATEIGSGDAAILHELDRFRGRTDFPLAKHTRLWTLDAKLAAHT